MDTYEKKYKDALERARIYRDNAKAAGEYAMVARYENIFPELAESEDERIRKKLYNTVMGTPNDSTWFDGTSKEAMLAWLEKQKDIEERWLEDREGCFWDGVAEGRKQKEQKPVQSAEEKEFVRTIKSIIADFIRDKKPEDVGFYQQIYDWLDGRHIEQKPVDKNKVGNLYPKEYPATPDECIKPAEWSEEDEHRRKDAIYFLESAMKHYADTSEIEKTIDWLKSIRPAQDCSADCPKHLEGYISGRADAENKLLEMYGILLMPDGELRMKPRWKPSEEQMDALQSAIDACESEWAYQDDELRSLLNNLKKLM